ncbi:MAG: dethiobiotin synthase [Janthinobacterium lividum]
MTTLSVFVTGTDTEVGKTLVASGLLRGLAARQLRAAALKPIAAGAFLKDGVWHNDDVDRLTAAATVTLPLETQVPYLLHEPAAPHIVAAQRGVSLDISKIVAAYQAAAQVADAVVVEGVGGFLVPLDDSHDCGDLACALGLPIVLVVGIRLGCINHALLTIEAIAARGLRCVGWVANLLDSSMLYCTENVDTIARRLAARHAVPLLGIVPWLADAEARDASPHVNALGMAEAAAQYLDMDRFCNALQYQASVAPHLQSSRQSVAQPVPRAIP